MCGRVIKLNHIYLREKRCHRPLLFLRVFEQIMLTTMRAN